MEKKPIKIDRSNASDTDKILARILDISGWKSHPLHFTAPLTRKKPKVKS